MQIIPEIFIAVIVGYLAFTNALSVTLIDLFDTTEESSIIMVEQSEEPSDDMPSLPSRIGKAIPDILLRSAQYQAAAVAGSAGLVGASTREPLEAIVNIFCTFTSDTIIKTTTGTGFFIDPDGVIMTNAHVAQFLLLEETSEGGITECIVRSGDPATPQYQAKLLYLPPAWIQDNASVMSAAVPMGTGERDYALLYVSSRLNGEPLPAIFPSLGFNSQLLPLSSRNMDVLAAGYPATPLLMKGAGADLVPKRATTSVSELYTFGSNYADVFSIRGSIVGAEGSSGGPVLNDAGEVIGMIVTRGDDSTDGVGSLRAITLSHIERTILEETSFSLQENLSGNLSFRAEVFATTMSPFLLSILQQAN
jgi:S1-C subfamily serine protease